MNGRPAVGPPHRWKVVGWLDGQAILRCNCDVERTQRSSVRGVPRVVRSFWNYRRRGEEAWGVVRLPCCPAPAPTVTA